MQSARRNIFNPRALSLLGTVLAEERHNPDFLARFQERITKPRRQKLEANLARGREMGEIGTEADLGLMGDMLIGPLFARYLGGHPVSSISVQLLVERVWRAFAPG